MAWTGSIGNVVIGALLGAGIVLLFGESGSANYGGRALQGLTLRPSMVSPAVHEPNWIGVLPDNIIDQQLPMVRNPHYGMHVIALGKNGSLFHKYQTGEVNKSAAFPHVPMTNWICLTPNVAMIFGNDTNPTSAVPVFGNSPAIALNADGRIELFVGYKPDSLDIWQMYQTDPKDPLAWSAPRAPYCDPSLTSCITCLKDPKCTAANFYTTGYAWTTSQQSLWLEPTTKKLKLTWRSFDGHLYEMTQSAPSMSASYPLDLLQYAIME